MKCKGVTQPNAQSTGNHGESTRLGGVHRLGQEQIQHRPALRQRLLASPQGIWGTLSVCGLLYEGACTGRCLSKLLTSEPGLCSG